jgi:hypothetical protein
MLRISFFKTPKHRVFNYQPRYWDPEKEAREERLENAKKPQIRGSFQAALRQNRKHSGFGTAGRIIFLITVAALLFAAIYFTKVVEVVLQKVAV